MYVRILKIYISTATWKKSFILRTILISTWSDLGKPRKLQSAQPVLRFLVFFKTSGVLNTTKCLKVKVKLSLALTTYYAMNQYSVLN